MMQRQDSRSPFWFSAFLQGQTLALYGHPAAPKGQKHPGVGQLQYAGDVFDQRQEAALQKQAGLARQGVPGKLQGPQGRGHQRGERAPLQGRLPAAEAAKSVHGHPSRTAYDGLRADMTFHPKYKYSTE